MKNSQLVAFLNKFHNIPASLLEESGVKIEEVELKKNDHLLIPGDSSSTAGYVVSGLCRQYYLSEAGKEHTKYFQSPGSVAIAFAEMLSNKPARCYIQAVVDTRLIIMSHPNFPTLFDIDIDSQTLARRIAEHYFIEKDQREYEFLHFDAKKRYNAFIERYKECFKLIPQYQIASYIGVTPVALSRLLAKPKSPDNA